MKLVFLILCFLLLFFNFETVNILSKTKDGHFMIIWKITENKHLFHLLPQEIFLLLDHDTFYLYLEDHTESTYIPAINLKTNYKVNVINYIYLREWTEFTPKVQEYDDSLDSVPEIINSLI